MSLLDLIEAEVLKLKKDSPEVEAFMKDFNAGTDPHPFDKQRLYKYEVGIHCWPGGEKEIHLASIMTFADKNSGLGSKALDWFCGLADKHGLNISLDVVPIKNAGSRTGKNLNRVSLKQWYERHGFKKEYANVYIRTAKPSK